jgi:hypothetical protein
MVQNKFFYKKIEYKNTLNMHINFIFIKPYKNVTSNGN